MSAAEVTALVPRQDAPLATMAMKIEDMIYQKKLIAQVVTELMHDGEHYGVIPGTEKKDKDGKDISRRSLWKPGADLLCSIFRLDADYETEECVRTPSLIYYRLKCVLKHAPTGIRVGAGMGSCNSNEDKYLRAAPRKCPVCGKESIIKGREEFGGGWLCWKKKDGCGAKFKEDEPGITQQDTGIKDPADLDNTILKMAAKRARIDAVLTVTAASDFFTQDLEDLTSKEVEYTPPKDDLKEKLEASIAQQAPEAAKAQEAKKFGKRFPKAAAAAENAAPSPSPGASATPSTAAAENAEPRTLETAPATSANDIPRAASDDGEPATDAQKDAIKSHMRKKGWKMQFVRVWFAELFGIPPSVSDPFAVLSQLQADAAHFLVLAHGTANYRKIRMEYADQGLVRRDENDVQF